jgi:hypothetical protein
MPVYFFEDSPPKPKSHTFLCVEHGCNVTLITVRINGVLQNVANCEQCKGQPKDVKRVDFTEGGL